MRQIYYVIRTLLRGRSSNVVKVISLGLGLTMSILLFARWQRQSRRWNMQAVKTALSFGLATVFLCLRRTK